MEIRFFDSFNEFLTSLKSYTSIDKFFEGKMEERLGYVQIRLSDGALLDAYRFLSKNIYKSRKAQKECFEAMIDGRGDYSYFQGFYIESYGKVDGARVGNSISGDAYEHRKRMFLKSTR